MIVRLGVPDDFVTGKTTQALAAFNRKHPEVKLEVTSGLSRDLIASYDRGELDLALVKQRRNSREAVACRPENMVWIDSAKHPSFHLDPVPLVTFPPRGLCRDDMIQAIEAMGRNWRIAFTSSSLSAIQGAVADGMGIGLLPPRAVTADHVLLGEKDGLRRIDDFEIAIVHRPTADPVVKELVKALVAMLDRESR
ncbi:LysR substrate binding domain protein [compost metagenome]